MRSSPISFSFFFSSSVRATSSTRYLIDPSSLMIRALAYGAFRSYCSSMGVSVALRMRSRVIFSYSISIPTMLSILSPFSTPALTTFDMILNHPAECFNHYSPVSDGEGHYQGSKGGPPHLPKPKLSFQMLRFHLELHHHIAKMAYGGHCFRIMN